MFWLDLQPSIYSFIISFFWPVFQSVPFCLYLCMFVIFNACVFLCLYVIICECPPNLCTHPPFAYSPQKKADKKTQKCIILVIRALHNLEAKLLFGRNIWMLQLLFPSTKILLWNLHGFPGYFWFAVKFFTFSTTDIFFFIYFGWETERSDKY